MKRYVIDTGSYYVVYTGEQVPEQLKKLGTVTEVTDESKQEIVTNESSKKGSQQIVKQQKQSK